MRSPEKERKSDSFLLFILSCFLNPCRPLFTIILGFYSHILSSLGTVKASFHLLIACLPATACRSGGQSGVPHMKRPPSQEGSSSPASSELRAARPQGALDRLLWKAPLLENKLFLRRERAFILHTQRPCYNPSPGHSTEALPREDGQSGILRDYRLFCKDRKLCISHYNIDIQTK